MHTASFTSRKTALLYLGILFCALLVTFAVATKVAVYYPHNETARPIAATKVWKDYTAATEPASPMQEAPMPLLFAFAALAAIALSASWKQTTVALYSADNLCSRRVHAIRPPPRA